MEHLKKSYSLKERILGLRISAQIIYDNGMARGLPGDQIMASLEPLTTAINDLIKHAAEHDIPGCVLAVKSLQHESKAHEQDARFLIEKSENAKMHVEKIEQAVWAVMKRKDTDRLIDNGYSVILVEDDQGCQSLQFR
jgi:hypothetical protein